MNLLSLRIHIGADTAAAEKGIANVQSGMEETEKKSKGIGSKIAGAFKVAGIGITAAVGAVGTAAAAVTKLTTAAAGATDRIDKMSQKVGMSRATFQEMDFIMSQSGGSVEGLQIGMKTLRSAMVSADGGSEDLQRAFSRLGISVKNADGTFRKQEDVMFDALSALQGVSDETERAALAQQLFGRSAIELTPLLNSGAGSIDAMRQQAHDLGLVLDDEAIDAGVKLTDTMDQVNRAFDAVKTKVGVSLMPVVQRILEVVLDNMPTIQKVLGAFFGVLGKVVSGAVKVIGWIAAPLKSLISMVVNGAFGALDGLKKKIAGLPITKKIADAINRVKGIFSGKSLSSIFTSAFKKLGTTLKGTKVGKLFTGIFESIKKQVNSFLYLLREKADIRYFIVSLLNGGKVVAGLDYDFKRYFFDKIGEFLTRLFGETFSDSFLSGLDKVIGPIKTLFDTLKTQFSPVIDAFKTLGSTIKGLFTGNNSIADIGTALKNIWQSLTFVDWGAIWNALKGAFASIKDNIINGVDWGSAGSAIWEAIKNGINAVSGWLLKLVLGDDWKPESGWGDVGDKVWGAITGGFNAAKTWLFQLVLGDDYTPESSWGDVGSKIWGAITGGFNAVNEWLLKLVLGDDWTPEANWGTVGSKLWGAITAGFNAANEWLLKLVLGDDWEPEANWGTVGSKVWKAIKDGFAAVNGWLLSLVLGDDYTPEANWGTVGSKLWGAITAGFNAANEWLLKLVLGDDWEPEANWGTVGEKVWTAIKNGFAVVNGWLLSLVLGDEYTPESGWCDVGDKIWTAIKAGFAVVSDWLIKLLLGEDEYTPESGWGDVGAKVWGAIKTGFGIASDWLIKLLLGEDEYTPDATWATVGTKIWGKILEGLASAVSWLTNLFTDWTTALSDGTVDFASIGSTIGDTVWGAIKMAFDGIVAWFGSLFGGENDEDPDSVKGAISGIDWAGLGQSMVDLLIAAWSGIGDILKGYFKTAWENINNLNWAGLGRNMWKAIKKAFATIGTWFTRTFKTPINLVIGMLNAMLFKVQEAVNNLINGINEKLHLHFEGVWIGWPINKQVAAFDWSPGIPTVDLGEIPLLANGGTVVPGGSAIVGEAGAELLRNIGGKAVVTPLGAGAGAGDTISINIYQQPGESAEVLADRVQRVLVRRERQRRAAI